MFNNFFYITMKPHVIEKRSDEIQEEFRQRMATRIGRNIRTRLDPGVNFERQQRITSVEARATDTGQILIKDNRPGNEVLKSTPTPSEPENAPVSQRRDSVEDLFKVSSGVPEVVSGPNGESRLAFRVIREKDFFNRAQEEQDGQIKRIVDSSIEQAFVDEMEGAIEETERRHPAANLGRERRVITDD